MEDPTLDDDDFDPDSLGEPNNDNFRRLRQRERAVTKADKAKATRITELEAKVAEFETQQRTATVREAAKAKGLTDAQVEVILTMSPSATAEQVEAFAKAFPGAAQAQAEGAEGEGEQAQQDQGQQAGFTPSGGGSKVPAAAYTDADIADARKRGDVTAIERMGAEVASGARKMDLKWGHLIED